MKKLIAIVFSSAFIFSCIKPVNDLKIPVHKSQISIVSDLSVGDSASAVISGSNSTLSKGDPEILSSALVQLLENNIVVDTLNYLKAYDFKGDYIIQPGKKYSVVVASANLNTAQGNTITPSNCVSISNVTSSITSDISSNDIKYGKVSFTLNQIVDEGQSYTFKINGKQQTLWVPMSSASPLFIDNSPDVLDPGYPYEYNGNAENINGKVDLSIIINPEKNQIYYGQDNSDSLVLEIIVSNSDKRKFLLTSGLYDSSYGNPFSEAVLIYQNVQSGYGTVMASKTYRYVLKP